MFPRSFFFAVACCCASTLLIHPAAGQTAQPTPALDVWIGTGSSPISRGIYHGELDRNTGKLSAPTLAAEVDGPGFVALHPNGRLLYAVGTLDGEPSVIAYAIEGQGKAVSLKQLNALAIGDGGAAHLSVDRTGQTILTAQYGGGSVAVFSLNDDGSLKERTQLIEHEGGSKVVAGRQDASHAHWVGFSPDNRFAFVPDLGLDQVLIYRFDAAGSQITPHGVGQTPPGSGPRHMRFHTNGRWIYVLNELDLSVTVFDYDAQKGVMTPKQTVPTVPKDQLAKEQSSSASEIHAHANGRFVYAANRGHDTISVFAVDSETGELTLIEREPVRGATPRNFNIDPSGRWLVAAGQDSNSLASFAIDQQTGELTYNRSNVFAPTPICVVFGQD